MKSHSKSGFRQMPEPPTPCTVSLHGRPGNSLAVFSLLGAEAPGKSQLHSPPWGLGGPDAHHLPTRPGSASLPLWRLREPGRWAAVDPDRSRFPVGGASKDIPRPATGCLEIAADPGSWEATLLGNR